MRNRLSGAHIVNSGMTCLPLALSITDLDYLVLFHFLHFHNFAHQSYIQWNYNCKCIVKIDAR